MQDNVLKNMEDFYNRLHKLLKDKELNILNFSQKINRSSQQIYQMFARKGKINITLLMDIKSAFPDVNLNWLISGQGSMYVSDTIKKEQNNEIKGNEIEYLNAIITYKNKALKRTEQLLEKTEEEVSRLKSELEKKDKECQAQISSREQEIKKLQAKLQSLEELLKNIRSKQE